MTLIDRTPLPELRVSLECGHTRTATVDDRRVECWSCGTVQPIIGRIP